MKGKYLVILLLLVALGVMVWQMILFTEHRTLRDNESLTTDSEEKEEPFVFMSKEELSKLYPEVDYLSMTSGDYFKVLRQEVVDGKEVYQWRTIYLKGVNLGVAMPGHFPVEFSLSFKEYLEWFIQIGKMNANVIRTYTILPPEFYNAFAYYNLQHQNRPLYLFQGIWAEEPKTKDYFSPDFIETYQKEIRNTVDVMNGKAVLKPQVGHASGIYTTNVSNYVLGYLLGREWEPQAVYITNQKNKESSFNGNFVAVHEATPMEVWLAQMMDYTVQYETQTYLCQHPISFINWLTLDPMYHNSEFIESKKVKEYDNDLLSLDFRKFHATELFDPGIFASYHVYPYYPDYVFLEEKYQNRTNYKGNKDNFLAYLEDLKSNIGSMPLVIAEYGLPSSRGVSHFTPFGLNQGGYNEAEQATYSADLTYDIWEAKCAGGIFFEWIDEWFKHNWLVMDFEQPADRRIFWHNMENPEQNFGIMAVESRIKSIDANLDDWPDSPPRNKKPFVRADADATYFYLLAYLPDVDLKKHKIFFALDTYSKNKGSHKLPFLSKELANGIEFLINISSKAQAEILVNQPYSVYTDVLGGFIPTYASQANDKGLFVPQELITNREKITIFGDTIPKVILNRSFLQHGKSSDPNFSNANWFWNEKTHILELRLSWHLLNVSDPSSRSVLDDVAETPDIEYSKTKGFHIFTYITDKKQVPLSKNETPYTQLFYKWDTWETPKYETRLKPIYDTLSLLFTKLDVPKESQIRKEVTEKFVICPYYENKLGAISITFDDVDYNQYLYALPLLNKYHLKANFGVVQDWIKEHPTFIAEEGGFALKRMGVEQIREIVSNGHEISFHGGKHQSYQNRNEQEIETDLIQRKKEMEELFNTKISVVHYPYSSTSPFIIAAAKKAGFLFGRVGDTPLANNKVLNYMKLPTVVVYNSQSPNPSSLDSLLKQRSGLWTIFLYHHIFSKDSKEYKLFNKHNVTHNYTITPDELNAHIRLIRNSNYWIAPISEVGKYIMLRNMVQLKSERKGNTIVLHLSSSLNTDIYNHPLTIEYTTSHKRFMIRNAVSDGIYTARDQKLIFNVYPNQDVTLEIIE